VAKRGGSSTSLSTSPSSSANSKLIVRSICACAMKIAVILDGWPRASCVCVPSSSGATAMVEAGVVEGNVVVDIGAVDMTLTVVAVAAGEVGGGMVSAGGGCVMLGWSRSSSASRCRIRSISAVIAVSSDL